MSRQIVLGCIQIPSDFVLEDEGPPLVERFPGVEMRMLKVHFDSDEICAATYLRAMERHELEKAAALLAADGPCTVVGLSCTSFAFTVGKDRVREELLSGYGSDVPTMDMAEAQMGALLALQVSRVALLTPYIEEVSVANAAMLERGGLQVVSRLTMNLAKDELTSAVTPEVIADWAVDVDCAEAEAVVIGCSAFRACQPGFLDSLEARVGKPVVTSTQAFLWRMLRMAKVQDHVDGYGCLFSKC